MKKNNFFTNLFKRVVKDDWEPVWVDFILNPAKIMGGEDKKLSVYEIWFSKSKKAYQVRICGDTNSYLEGKSQHIQKELEKDLAWKEMGIYLFGADFRWYPEKLEHLKKHFHLLRIKQS